MMRSTMIVPGPGFGLMSEPIAKCGESAANALLPAAPVGILLPPPPPYPPPPPPPQAASPSREDSITEAVSCLKAKLVRVILVSFGENLSTGEPPTHAVNGGGGRTLPEMANSCGRSVIMFARGQRRASNVTGKCYGRSHLW